MSSSEGTNSNGTVLTKENFKEVSRGDRISMKPQIQEKLRNELKEIAFDNCKDTIKALGECSKREGMLVAFNCRDLNKASKCVKIMSIIAMCDRTVLNGLRYHLSEK